MPEAELANRACPAPLVVPSAWCAANRAVQLAAETAEPTSLARPSALHRGYTFLDGHFRPVTLRPREPLQPVAAAPRGVHVGQVVPAKAPVRTSAPSRRRDSKLATALLYRLEALVVASTRRCLFVIVVLFRVLHEYLFALTNSIPDVMYQSRRFEEVLNHNPCVSCC